MQNIKSKIISLLLILSFVGNIIIQLSPYQTYEGSAAKESVISSFSETAITGSNFLQAKKVSNNYERINYSSVLQNSSRLLLGEERYLIHIAKNMSIEYRDKNFFTFLHTTST